MHMTTGETEVRALSEAQASGHLYTNPDSMGKCRIKSLEGKKKEKEEVKRRERRGGEQRGGETKERKGKKVARE